MTSAIGVLIGALVGALGLGGILLIVLAANPEKVQLWSAWVLGAIRKVTKRAELAYVATDVAAQVNSHLRREMLPALRGLTATGIAIRWDNSSDTVAQEKAGTLVIKLRRHEDRLLNVLSAYMIASPRLFAPTVRSQLTPTQSRGVDLQLCRRLAESLSRSAMTVYRLNILDPRVALDGALAPLLSELQTVDQGGLFVPVFLQELVKLGATFPADTLPGLEHEVSQLIVFLRTVSQRAPGEIVELSFVGKYIRINTLLVARAETRGRGVEPFRSRVGLELAKGVDTFYVMATEANIAFARDVAHALDGDRRLMRGDERLLTLMRQGIRVQGLVIPFERNQGYTGSDYLRDAVAAGVLAPGTEHMALVTDVQPSYVTVAIDGLQGLLPIAEVDWRYVADCRDSLAIGQEIPVSVLDARVDQHELIVSRRRRVPNPVTAIGAEALRGQRLTFVVRGRIARQPGAHLLVGHLKEHDSVPARLCEGELEWGAPLHGVAHIPDGAEILVVVYEIRESAGYVLCSKKRLSANHWEEIRTKYRRGSALEVHVAAVRDEGAWCEIEPGLTGFVPADEFRQAGLEYQAFRTNLREGAHLFVYVRRVVAGDHQRINLGLQRNLTGRTA